MLARAKTVYRSRSPNRPRLVAQTSQNVAQMSTTFARTACRPSDCTPLLLLLLSIIAMSQNEPELNRGPTSLRMLLYAMLCILLPL